MHQFTVIVKVKVPVIQKDQDIDIIVSKNMARDAIKEWFEPTTCGGNVDFEIVESKVVEN